MRKIANEKKDQKNLSMSNEDTLSMLGGQVLFGQLALESGNGPTIYTLPFVFYSGILYLPWKKSMRKKALPRETQLLCFVISDITRMYCGNFSLATVNCYGKKRRIAREESIRARKLFDKKYEMLAPFDGHWRLFSLACDRIIGCIHAEDLRGDL